MTTRAITAFSLALLVGCAESLAPQNATRFDPPPTYFDWWAEMEACSGHVGNIFNVRWYSAPESAFPHTESDLIRGVWQAPHNIYLVDIGTNHRHLVAHEILHDLTQDAAHGAEFDACGVR